MKTALHERIRRDPYLMQRAGVLLVSLLVLLASLLIAYHSTGAKPVSAVPSAPPCLILDPGHGGFDGGAVAYNGVKESDLNLAIALKLRDLASFCGQPTLLTREDDSPRTDAAGYSEHEDLVYRAERINAVGGGLCISIHQNTFPTSQPRGAQVLCGPGEESRRLGELTQSGIVAALQPENRRLAAPAPAKLYLPSHVSCPMILLESGFLSNLDDLQQLSSDAYQTKLAAVLLQAALRYENKTA